MSDVHEIILRLGPKLERLISYIGPPNQAACHALWREHQERFALAPGSSHNHQAWPGGYLDHVIEGMEIACLLHPTMASHHPLPFTLSDALLCFFLHDLEKPWRHIDGKPNPQLATKVAKAAFRMDMISQYEIVLTPAQVNGIKYAEGENDDYTPKARVMNELAAFVHICDIASARIWHDQPRKSRELESANR